MRNTSQLLAAATLFVFGSLTVVHADTWPKEFLVPVPIPSANPNAVRPLVVLRFPFSISERDLPAAEQSYSKNIGWYGHSGADNGFPNISNAFQLMILKSSYHGVELGHCLQETLDGVLDVLLEPATVGRHGGNWAFTSPSRALPATLVIDFTAYVTPQANSLQKESYGESLKALYSLRVSPLAAPTTKGAAAIEKYWLYLASQDIGLYDSADSHAGLGAAVPQFLNAPALPLGFLSAAKMFNTLPLPVPKTSLSKSAGYRPGYVTILDDFRYKLDLDANGKDRSHAARDENCAALTNLTLAIVNDPAVSAVEAQRFAAYQSAFDGSTTATAKITQPSSEYHRNMLTSFYNAEVRFAKAQDDRLVSVLSSGWLETYYAARAQEMKFAGAQNMAALMAMPALIAGGVSLANGNSAATQSAVQRGLADLKRDDETIRSSIDSFTGVYDSMSDFSIEIDVAGTAIRTNSQHALREQLRELYRSKTQSHAE